MTLVIICFAVCCFAAGQSADSLFLKAAIIKLPHSKDYTLEVALLMPGVYYGFKPRRAK